ncbi:MAG: tetratricopeptide repeat protein, partial [Thermodesulfobacteriota bacterium]|nr:tetratricopeptide repeat protein [Thermodesulfobacteriota bacterium]
MKEGEPAPDFKLKALDGKTYSLSDSKKKVGIILYWRTDQERSLNALKALKQLYNTFSDQPVRILSITKETDTSAINEVKQSHKLPFPVLRDTAEDVYSQFGVFVFPSTAIIDQKGIYCFHYGGYREDYEKEIGGRVKVLLGLMSEGDLKGAKGQEVVLSTEEQKRARNHINLGKTLHTRGMDEKAILEFQKAVELDGSNPEGHILLGLLLLDQGETDEALNHLNTGMELNPKSRVVKIGLGRAYRMKGQTDKALTVLKAELELNPDSEVIHLELGKIYESLGQTDEALKHYKASAELSLEGPGAYY